MSPDSTEYVLQIDDVSVSYGSRKVVDSASLTLKGGEVVALLGPNGAGKSSIMSAIAGVISHEGRIAVLGNSLSDDPLQYKTNIAVSSQPVFLYDYLTATEHVDLVAQMHGHDKCGPDFLSRVGLTAHAGKLCRELSYGMRQRVSLAATLACRSKLLLLDETMNGLDPRAAKLARAAIRDVAEGGASVIMSTHIIGALDKQCNRVVIMDEGKIVCDVHGEELDELRSRGTSAIEALYLANTSEERA